MKGVPLLLLAMLGGLLGDDVYELLAARLLDLVYGCVDAILAA